MTKRLICCVLSFIILTCAFAPCLGTGAVFYGDDKVVIVLDPGHGGSSVGTASEGRAEKTYTLRLALLIKQKLEANGNFTVYLTRTGDTFSEICERAIFANSVNADAVVSIHFDGSTNSQDHGATAYTSVLGQYALVNLSQQICSNISAYTGLASNGVKQKKDTEGYYWNYSRQWDSKDSSLGTLSDYYGIPTWCAKFGIPSVIVEHGYFTNYADSQIIFADGTLDRLASADADAIISCYTNHTHTYSDARTDFPSNCMFGGKQSCHCTTCGHRKNIIESDVDYNNHYWETTDSSPAACGRDGYVTQVCRITENLNEKGYECESHTRTTVIPAATQHEYQLKSDVPATHTINGHKTYICKNCGDSYTTEIPAEGHSYEYVSFTIPDCTRSGGTLYRCTVCGDEWTDTLAAYGHTYEIVSLTPATCTKEGERLMKCTVCGETKTEEIPSPGHVINNWEHTSATCTEDGKRSGVCAVCGETVVEKTSATGHSYENEVLSEATCTLDGEVLHHCTVCGYEEKETVPAAGHRYLTTERVIPDCLNGGRWTGKCTVCGEITELDIPALGHRYIDIGIIRAAGTILPGRVRYVCVGCGKTGDGIIYPWILTDGKLIFAVTAAFVLGSAVIFICLFKKTGRLKSRRKKKRVQSAR